MISVSIIIPVYNVSRYIERCLVSVISQTYSGPIECILVDDRGNDDSMEKAAKYLSGYSGPIRFKTIVHEKNMGLSEARNSGIRQASGDYLIFLDSDDELTYSAIEAMAGMVEKYPGVDMVMGNYYFTPVLEPSAEVKGWEYAKGLEDVKRKILRTGTLPDFAHNKLVRRDVITKNNLYFRPGLLLEDNLWTWHMAKHIESLAVVKDGTYVYFNTPGSILNSANPKKSSDRLEIAIEKCNSIDPVCAPEQLRHAAGFLIDAESELRHVFRGEEKEQNLEKVKKAIAMLKEKNAEAKDLRTWLSLLCLSAEFTFSLDVSDRKYWIFHRAAKMFAVCPRP